MASRKKTIEKTNTLVGEIYEELNSFGVQRYKPFTYASKPSDEWKAMSKKFEKVFANFRKLMEEEKK